jgi:hypothetical protein
MRRVVPTARVVRERTKTRSQESHHSFQRVSGCTMKRLGASGLDPAPGAAAAAGSAGAASAARGLVKLRVGRERTRGPCARVRVPMQPRKRRSSGGQQGRQGVAA